MYLINISLKKETEKTAQNRRRKKSTARLRLSDKDLKPDLLNQFFKNLTPLLEIFKHIITGSCR